MIVRGTRSADEVWADYIQIDRWPTWAPHMTSVDATAPRIREGVTGHVHGGPLKLAFVIKEVSNDAMTWTWEVLGITLEHSVRGTPTGCLTEFRGPLPYLPVAWIALRRLVSARRQQPGHRVHR